MSAVPLREHAIFSNHIFGNFWHLGFSKYCLIGWLLFEQYFRYMHVSNKLQTINNLDKKMAVCTGEMMITNWRSGVIFMRKGWPLVVQEELDSHSKRYVQLLVTPIDVQVYMTGRCWSVTRQIIRVYRLSPICDHHFTGAYGHLFI
jgi:hypothetical protein